MSMKRLQKTSRSAQPTLSMRNIYIMRCKLENFKNFDNLLINIFRILGDSENASWIRFLLL